MRPPLRYRARVCSSASNKSQGARTPFPEEEPQRRANGAHLCATALPNPWREMRVRAAGAGKCPDSVCYASAHCFLI